MESEKTSHFPMETCEEIPQEIPWKFHGSTKMPVFLWNSIGIFRGNSRDIPYLFFCGVICRDKDKFCLAFLERIPAYMVQFCQASENTVREFSSTKKQVHWHAGDDTNAKRYRNILIRIQSKAPAIRTAVVSKPHPVKRICKRHSRNAVIHIRNRNFKVLHSLSLSDQPDRFTDAVQDTCFVSSTGACV